jgi:hypothetical protein
MIAREYSLGIDKSMFKKIYESCTEKKQDFLLIDLEGEKDERFRKNFDEVFEVPDMF